MNAKKALKHDIEVAGKTIPTMILVGLFLVGGGSAALLTSFGTVDGTANVESQAIGIQGDSDNAVSFSYDSRDAVVPPLTENKEVTMVNNNQDASVGFSWEITENEQGAGTGNDLSYINTGVYNVSTYELVQAPDSSETKASADLEATATPSVDTVTYTAEVPTDYFSTSSANLNFQISPKDKEGEDTPVNYQVTYYGGSDETDWQMKPVSLGSETIKGKSKVLARDEVVAVDFTDNENSPDVVSVTVKKPGAKQSFAVQATDGGEGYGKIHTPGWTDGRWADQSTISHKQVGQNLDGQTVTLQGGASQTFNVVTQFTAGTGSGTYSVTADAAVE